MNVLDLVDEISSEAELTKGETRRAIPAIFSAIEKALSDGQEVRLGGIGKLVIAVQGPRTGRNIHTGAKIDIPERRVVRFKPFPAMKTYLNPVKKPGRRVHV